MRNFRGCYWGLNMTWPAGGAVLLTWIFNNNNEVIWAEFLREDMIGRFVLQLIMQFSQCWLFESFSLPSSELHHWIKRRKKSQWYISNSLFMAGYFQWWTKLALKQTQNKSEQNMTGYIHTFIIYKWQWCLTSSHQKILEYQAMT